jgi:hypothetical protein
MDADADAGGWVGGGDVACDGLGSGTNGDHLG